MSSSALLPIVAGCCGWGLTGLALKWLRHRQILDHPNERSSHTMPTPRGGGWGILLTVLPMAAVAGLQSRDLLRFAPILLGAATLMLVSWADDRRRHGVPPLIRLSAQAAAVAAGLMMLPDEALIFQGLLPALIDRAFAALAWLWFINLFNFMDGIDGLAGGEAASIGFGAALVAHLIGLPPIVEELGLIIAGAACGFLVWNWQPARVFMGDVGSVPLGYALGGLLLTLAVSGAWAAAALLPAYFVADATLTLCRRALRGEPVWRAHREHAYQKAVQAGRRHAEVTRLVLAANVVLIGLSAWSISGGMLPALAIGGVLTWGVLRFLSKPQVKN